ncbi:MAG: potassium-transporting ATPase subunit C [Chloroflexi bacterium HGW-Chloroflexi-5]|jgi:K+-transporting ATPase ATPase C chain|nr:MAG: potassium-transporting ATPase subunit C [Deltaproteobacteria bacterium HGW-Deltaproteobacteria-12]PKN96834.1 MAG: potassium-transporting ATPase subunit C [Chloroflexi bacterium HGW-Chloroflexi-5]
MKHLLRQAFLLLFFLTLLTGFLYPLFITGLSQAIFPRQANGSLILGNSRLVGSDLIGQPFTSPRYFWGRPSATAPFPYNSTASTGSNWGPSSAEFMKIVQQRIDLLRKTDLQNRISIPVDLVTSSGSGLDPHISPAAALYQVPRVAKARNLDEKLIRNLVLSHIQGRAFGVLGESIIHVLTLNMALDNLR